MDAYPRGGDVAFLCEGDLVGYEAAIIRKWADAIIQSKPVVDVWPCGTKDSIFGMSDALGRLRPILIVEDRDFRTWTEAEADCRDNQGSRERRGVRVLSWRAWRRNEIENYFLEDEVMMPFFQDVFGCTEDQIKTFLQENIAVLSVYQTAQYAFYRARRLWLQNDPAGILPQKIGCRPKWDDATARAMPCDVTRVREELLKNLQSWRERNANHFKDSATDIEKYVLTCFDDKYKEWQKVGFGSPQWREDWAGKEILQWLRIGLSSRYGWYDPTTKSREKIKWASLDRRSRDERDRKIEAEIKQELVKRFVEFILGHSSGDIIDEWASIGFDLQKY